MKDESKGGAMLIFLRRLRYESEHGRRSVFKIGDCFICPDSPRRRSMMVIRVHTFFLMLFRLSFYAVVLCFLSSIGACDKGSQDLAKLQQEYDKAMQHALVKVPYARD